MRDLQSIVQDNYWAVARACEVEGKPLVIERNDLTAARWQPLPIPHVYDVPEGYLINRTFGSAAETRKNFREGYGYALVHLPTHIFYCELVQEPTDGWA